MNYLLIPVSFSLSVAAYVLWSRRFAAWWSKRLDRAEDMADALLPLDWPALFVVFLPKKPRRLAIWASIWCMTLFLGGLHFLVLHGLITDAAKDPWLPLHYSWTLGLWLGLLAFPAWMMTRHQAYTQAQNQRAGG
jgi:hypothetical protein